ncbi:MAG: polC [Candidatus Saccharibacteria bacterium]|nr:polC [Candidatus Saccharibacteria bacterium]
MKHRPLVFLDIETTGGSPRFSRITEIGALRVEDGKIVKTFKQLINPEERVPSFITNLTGITDEMLWDAPLFKGIADELEVFLDDALFIAHNVSFDYNFIKMEFERMGLAFNMDRACSARLSRRLYPEHKSHALDRLIERMNIDVTNRHRAYDDAEVIWKFFQVELKKRELELYSAVNKVTTYARPQKVPITG